MDKTELNEIAQQALADSGRQAWRVFDASFNQGGAAVVIYSDDRGRIRPQISIVPEDLLSREPDANDERLSAMIRAEIVQRLETLEHAA